MKFVLLELLPACDVRYALLVPAGSGAVTVVLASGYGLYAQMDRLMQSGMSALHAYRVSIATALAGAVLVVRFAAAQRLYGSTSLRSFRRLA